MLIGEIDLAYDYSHGIRREGICLDRLYGLGAETAEIGGHAANSAVSGREEIGAGRDIEEEEGAVVVERGLEVE